MYYALFYLGTSKYLQCLIRSTPLSLGRVFHLRLNLRLTRVCCHMRESWPSLTFSRIPSMAIPCSEPLRHHYFLFHQIGLSFLMIKLSHHTIRRGLLRILLPHQLSVKFSRLSTTLGSGGELWQSGVSLAPLHKWKLTVKTTFEFQL